MNRKIDEWLPAPQSLQQRCGKESPDDTADQRNQHRLRHQLPQHFHPAGTDRQSNCQFTASVCGTRGKNAAQVRARGQQHQQRQRHNSEQECM